MSVVLSALPERVTGGLVSVSIIGCTGFAVYSPCSAPTTGGGAPLLDDMALSVVKVVFVTMPMLIRFSL